MTSLRRSLPAAAAVAVPVVLGRLLAGHTGLLEVVAALLLAMVVIFALLCGRWPAVLSAVVGAVVLNYWFTDPVGTLRVGHLNDLLVLLIFTVTAVLVSAFLDHAVSREVARSEAAGPEAPSDDAADTLVVVGDLRIDLDRCQVHKGEERVALTPTEWSFLALLARNVGHLVSREQILHEVWGPAYGKETHYLRIYIAQLRRKLEDDPAHPRHLITTPGRGYSLEP